MLEIPERDKMKHSAVVNPIGVFETEDGAIRVMEMTNGHVTGGKDSWNQFVRFELRDLAYTRPETKAKSITLEAIVQTFHAHGVRAALYNEMLCPSVRSLTRWNLDVGLRGWRTTGWSRGAKFYIPVRDIRFAPKSPVAVRWFDTMGLGVITRCVLYRGQRMGFRISEAELGGDESDDYQFSNGDAAPIRPDPGFWAWREALIKRTSRGVDVSFADIDDHHRLKFLFNQDPDANCRAVRVSESHGSFAGEYLDIVCTENIAPGAQLFINYGYDRLN